MHEGRQKCLWPLAASFIDHGEIERTAIGEIDPQLVMAVLEHVIEGGAPPVFARRRPSLVEPYSKMSLSLVSVAFQRKSAAFEDRMQRIDEGPAPPRQIEPACPAALAEAAQQIVSRADRSGPGGTSQFIRRKRGDSSMTYYAAQCWVIKSDADVENRHCEPTGRRTAPPDDRLREAIQLL